MFAKPYLKGLFVVVCASLALTVGVSAASAGGGTSNAAKACQHGGWENLARSDGSAFKNEGDCVSYAAQGGTLQPKGFSFTGCKTSAHGDFLVTGAINTSPNGELFNSVDGSCSGSPRIEGTAVEAADLPSATTICQALIAGRGLLFDGVVSAGGVFPGDYWFCAYEL